MAPSLLLAALSGEPVWRLFMYDALRMGDEDGLV